ncbi:uncharacterized protein LOC121912964, partial [Scomber scombrus]
MANILMTCSLLTQVIADSRCLQQRTCYPIKLKCVCVSDVPARSIAGQQNTRGPSKHAKNDLSPGTYQQLTDQHHNEPNLQVLVIRAKAYQSNKWVDLKCHSSSCLPDRSSFIWYKNGQKISRKTSSTYEGYYSPEDIYSCALKGFEHHPAPSV